MQNSLKSWLCQNPQHANYIQVDDLDTYCLLQEIADKIGQESLLDPNMIVVVVALLAAWLIFSA
jgi:hypothetical protein